MSKIDVPSIVGIEASKIPKELIRPMIAAVAGVIAAGSSVNEDNPESAQVQFTFWKMAKEFEGLDAKARKNLDAGLEQFVTLIEEYAKIARAEITLKNK